MELVDKQKFIILVHDALGGVEMLGTVLDREDHWESNGNEYKSTVNNNIRLDIQMDDEQDDMSVYVYSIDVDEYTSIELIDTKSLKTITDRIPLNNLMNILEQSDDCEVQYKSKAKTEVKIEINGQDLIVSSIKLIGFANKKNKFKTKFIIKVNNS